MLAVTLTKRIKMKTDLNDVKFNKDQSKGLNFLLCCC